MRLQMLIVGTPPTAHSALIRLRVVVVVVVVVVMVLSTGVTNCVPAIAASAYILQPFEAIIGHCLIM